MVARSGTGPRTISEVRCLAHGQGLPVGWAHWLCWACWAALGGCLGSGGRMLPSGALCFGVGAMYFETTCAAWGSVGGPPCGCWPSPAMVPSWKSNSSGCHVVTHCEALTAYAMWALRCSYNRSCHVSRCFKSFAWLVIQDMLHSTTPNLMHWRLCSKPTCPNPQAWAGEKATSQWHGIVGVFLGKRLRGRRRCATKRSGNQRAPRTLGRKVTSHHFFMDNLLTDLPIEPESLYWKLRSVQSWMHHAIMKNWTVK